VLYYKCGRPRANRGASPDHILNLGVFGKPCMKHDYDAVTFDETDLETFLDDGGFVADDGEGLNPSIAENAVVTRFKCAAFKKLGRDVEAGTLSRSLILEPGCGPIYVTHKLNNDYVARYAVEIEYVNRPNDTVEL
jgi:hypothetical protein